MGSRVAIVVFFVFILAGFAIEAQGRKKVTLAVWLPLFWIIICASRSINQWLNLSSFDSYTYISSFSEEDYIAGHVSGSPVDQIVLSIAIACGILIIYKRREAAAGVFKNNKALLAFIIYLGISVLWSDITGGSFRRWARLIGHFVMAAVLLTESNPLESVRSVFRRTAYLLIPLSVMFIKYIPQIGILYSGLGMPIWAGASLMKNGLGHLCFVSSFCLVWDAIGSWGRKERMKFPRAIFDMIIVMMCLWLLRGSQSAASIGSLIFGIAMLIGSRVPTIKRGFGRIGTLVIVAVCLVLVLESSFGISKVIVTGLGRDETYTGRMPLWNTLLELGLKRPFLGYGYEGFWIGERNSIEGLNQAHNGYLEIFVEGGLVAIILLGVLLVSVFRKIQRGGLSDYGYAVFRLSLLAMILLANVTESSFARDRDLLTFVFFIIAMNDAAPSGNVRTLAPN